MRRVAISLGVIAIALAAALPSFHEAQIDPDYYWHVVLGGELLSGGKVYAPDDLSFATVRAPYRRHSWGADELLAEADRLGGLAGYRVIRALLRGATAALVALACLRANRGRSPALALGLAALVLPLCAQLEEVRPIALAHVLLAAAAAIHVGRDGPPGRLAGAATVAIALALSPIHPVAVILVAWLGAIAAGSLVASRLAGDAEARGLARERAGVYLRLGALAVLALAVDPRPFGALESLVFLRSDPMASGRFIAEWLAPQAVGSVGWLGIAIGLAATATLARSRRARADEALLLAGMLYVGYDLARNTILLAFVALPLMARHLGRGPRALRRLRAIAVRRAPALRALGRPAAGVALAGALSVALVSLEVSKARAAALADDPVAAAEAAGFPARATTWALEHAAPAGAPGRILAPYTWGGYIAYRAHPRFQVFQYGQNQLYDAAFWADFTQTRFLAVKRRLLEARGDVAILPSVPPDEAGPWLSILEDAGWTVAHREGSGVVLLPGGRGAKGE